MTSQLIISDCLYHMLAPFPQKSELYAVTIIEINAPKRALRDYNQHLDNKSNDDVEIVRFMRTKNLSKIPRGIKEIFPKIQVLIVNDCKITELNAEDFCGLEELKVLAVQHTPVKILTAESLKTLKNLEILTFHDTKLSFVDEKIFDSLKNLKEVYLTQNPGINLVFSPSDQPFTKVPSLNELKRVIRGCSACDSVCGDIKKLLADEKFKDFTVTVKESCFHGLDCHEKCCNEVLKVHKFLLIARSPVLAEMIARNPDAQNLNLIDIPAYAFKRVIEYFYNGILPSAKGDVYLKMKDLFVVADKLGLSELREFAKREMTMGDDNAVRNDDFDDKNENFEENLGVNVKLIQKLRNLDEENEQFDTNHEKLSYNSDKSEEKSKNFQNNASSLPSDECGSNSQINSIQNNDKFFLNNRNYDGKNEDLTYDDESIESLRKFMDDLTIDDRKFENIFKSQNELDDLKIIDEKTEDLSENYQNEPICHDGLTLNHEDLSEKSKTNPNSINKTENISSLNEKSSNSDKTSIKNNENQQSENSDGRINKLAENFHEIMDQFASNCCSIIAESTYNCEELKKHLAEEVKDEKSSGIVENLEKSSPNQDVNKDLNKTTEILSESFENLSESFQFEDYSPENTQKFQKFIQKYKNIAYNLKNPRSAEKPSKNAQRSQDEFEKHAEAYEIFLKKCEKLSKNSKNSERLSLDSCSTFKTFTGDEFKSLKVDNMHYDDRTAASLPNIDVSSASQPQKSDSNILKFFKRVNNEKSCEDFIKVDKKDLDLENFEIIDDFYDEVCSVE